MPKILIEILNEHGPGTRSSIERELESWDGFGSIAIAETLRALIDAFRLQKTSIVIRRDIHRPFAFVDYPSVQYMIWETKAAVDGKPALTGHIMIHRAFPDRDSRCTLRYTPTGARMRQQRLRQITASR